jgi:hypothetical protein
MLSACYLSQTLQKLPVTMPIIIWLGEINFWSTMSLKLSVVTNRILQLLASLSSGVEKEDFLH